MIVIPIFLKTTNELIFNPLKLGIKSIYLELESQEYNACELLLNDKKALFRTAKTTPTKTGQFVTLWKRTPERPIAPFHENDRIDLVFIHCETVSQTGCFIFPKKVLIEKGIFSTDLKEGKRAFRVYPPWDKTTSKQAQKTQEWQQDYFIELKTQNSIPVKLQQLCF
ncbi:MepB family protein [Flavobacterium sp. NG2]|uniref:MepB family protein n=1 Tax=Flavobacterium sp. NG2 TaxID=3097547 RepID=UPI002A7F3DD9|nr:MepB family protein [Flavobacterium sp. NG2]WPR70628.1 MepB family protein [Flavobacterium sp. NG2]